MFGRSKTRQDKTSKINTKAVDDATRQGEEALRDITLSKDLDENQKILHTIFCECFDLIIRQFRINEEKTRCFVAYFEGIVNKEEINKNIIKPLMNLKLHGKQINDDGIISNSKDEKEPSDLIELIKNFASPVARADETNQAGIIAEKILIGTCLIFVDGFDRAIILGVKKVETRKTNEAEIEPVLRGPAQGFVEDININTSLIRYRIKTPNLKLELQKTGRISKTRIVIAYIKGLADDKIVQEVRDRISRVNVDMIIESGNLEQVIEDTHYSPFPQIQSTERPDISAYALSEGRIVILIDGTPFVLIVPTVFASLMVTIENNYERFNYSIFILLFRYAAFLIALLMPALYIAITSFHQEMIPYPLFISIASSRANVPFPVFVEALLMEVTFELLREAGERLPRAIGQSLSIVGALVIGQAAVQAGLVSPAMVVILSMTATASFTIPVLGLSRTVRQLRFLLMVLGGCLGIFGIVMGLLTLMIHLISLRSFGIPYFSPFGPLTFKDWKTEVFRLPFWMAKNRPGYIQKNNIPKAK